MSTLRPNRANRSPDPTMTRQPQSRQRGRATSDADSLDACIAGLVLSNALPPAPPEIPSLYDWIDELCHQAQDILRQIIREILAVNRLIGEFQHVALGRDFSLLVQLYEYCPRLSELAAIRTDVRRWMEQNPDIDPDESVDSSDDEEFLPGRDSEPILDYDSDSDGPEEVRFHIGEGYHAPTITLRTGDVDAYLRDPYQQRRARRAGTARGRGGTQDLEYPVYSYVGYSSRVMQLAIDRATRTIERAGGHSNLGGDREDAGESSLVGSPDTDTGEFESERELEYASNESEEDTARGLVYEDRPASNGESAQSEEDDDDDEGSSMSTQSEADVDGDSQRPHEWQTFHQYFMYSCRGDLAAVTSQLQGQFDFVPEITQAWVGRQLNNTVYIEEQTQFLDFYLPGETGTLSRAAARWQMARSDFFIQDTYDGINAGQVVDIDLTSDDYTEPSRPEDLPSRWDPLLDAILLAVLPEIRSMETFWVENMALLQEDWRDGIGSLRRERALSLRCGQLRYLRLSEDQMAAGRERGRARLEARQDASALNVDTVGDAAAGV